MPSSTVDSRTLQVSEASRSPNLTYYSLGPAIAFRALRSNGPTCISRECQRRRSGHLGSRVHTVASIPPSGRPGSLTGWTPKPIMADGPESNADRFERSNSNQYKACTSQPHFCPREETLATSSPTSSKYPSLRREGRTQGRPGFRNSRPHRLRSRAVADCSRCCSRSRA